MAGVNVLDGLGVFVATFSTIQDAINSPQTQDGFTIRVIAADYAPVVPEAVTVTKELTIETDTNAGIDPNTGARGAEVMVDRFVVQADNVTIDGFTVSGTSFDERIEVINGATGGLITNNIIVQGRSIEAVLIEGGAEVSANNIQTLVVGIQIQHPDAISNVQNNVITLSTGGGGSGIILNGFLQNSQISSNNVTFSQPNTIGAGIQLSTTMQAVTLQNNAVSGGGDGILFFEFNQAFDQSSVVIAEDIANFTGQANTAIVLATQVIVYGVVIDETALSATSRFARSNNPDHPDGSLDGGTAYFTDLQAAIDTSFDFASIALSDNYGAAGAITVGKEGLTLDAPAGTSGTLTLDPGILNITLQGDGNIDVTGNASANRIEGNDGANTLTGGDDDDSFFGNGGNDAINGGVGTDTVLYAGIQAGYTVVDNGGGSFTVTDNNAADGDDGTDTLTGIESIVFNDAPVASADSGTVAEDSSVAVDVLANDTDADGTLDAASVEIEAADDASGKVKSVPGEGVWTVDDTDGSITFTPEADYDGAVTDIAYTVADDQGARSVPAAVSVTIIGDPFRVEAETMTIVSGFVIKNSGQSSGGQYLQAGGSGEQRASYTFMDTDGSYDLTVGHYDESDGQSQMNLWVNGFLAGSFVWDVDAGDAVANQTAFAEFTFSGVSLSLGDVIEISGFKDGGEPLRTDYLDFTFTGSGGGDTLAPFVQSAQAPDVGPAEAGTASTDITVTFADNAGIDFASIDAGDITVTGPGGALTVSAVSVDTGSDGSPRTATYTVAAPGGTWDTADEGSYTVALLAGEVLDTSGNAVAADPSLEGFTVALSDDGQPPITSDGYFDGVGADSNFRYKIQVESLGGTGVAQIRSGANDAFVYVESGAWNDNNSGEQGDGYFVFTNDILDAVSDVEDTGLTNDTSIVNNPLARSGDNQLVYRIMVPEEQVGEAFEWSFRVTRDALNFSGPDGIRNDQQNDLRFNVVSVSDPSVTLGDLRPNGAGEDGDFNQGFARIANVNSSGEFGNNLSSIAEASGDDQIIFPEAGLYDVYIAGRSVGLHIDHFEIYRDGSSPNPSGANSTFVAINETSPTVANFIRDAWLEPGSSLDITGNFGDVDGDLLAYTADVLPPGVSFVNGEFEVSQGAASVSGLDITVTATDDDLNSVSDTFLFTVTEPGGAGDPPELFRVEAETLLPTTDDLTVETNALASGGALLKATDDMLQEATYLFDEISGFYEFHLGIFDENDGQSELSVFVNGNLAGSIDFDEDAGSSTASPDSFRIASVGDIALNTGDLVSFQISRDGSEPARFDYFEVDFDSFV